MVGDEVWDFRDVSADDACHVIGDELREPEDFHTEMERRLRMNW